MFVLSAVLFSVLPQRLTLFGSERKTRLDVGGLSILVGGVEDALECVALEPIRSDRQNS